ncbi:MAG: malto-oligosyltrehalose trehalohydrolase [Syntrophobacteraceae bacterium]|nr:malto-oligosyltrehalose trehalohydrolase [Syntrophobacteraceae bacterium]
MRRQVRAGVARGPEEGPWLPREGIRLDIGPRYLGNDTTDFTVWGPLLECVDLVFPALGAEVFAMEKVEGGYWRARIEGIENGTRYLYRLNRAEERPDPASHFQPQGVHGPSQVVRHETFVWEDLRWGGIPLEETVFYEIHVGTFSESGTFRGILERLEALATLGVNALNLMPVAQFPGERNWGYDGVYPFAVQVSYGGPDGLKELVNACHQLNMAVYLDVVYNHLGPEGNYLGRFGPYFTSKYQTPWGDAVNYDGPYSDGVRNYFIQNALHWFRRYHIDGLRLDAVHAICDMSARPFLRQLAEEVEEYSEQQGRKFYLVAESDLNDERLIRSRAMGGLGLDALWCDDFHHSLHSLLTGERDGYYVDFGRVEHLAKAYREGFVYSGQYSCFRKRSHGNSARDCRPSRLVVFSQNHDQVGNRARGERMSALVGWEALKLAAGAYLLSPFVPLIFMGEEYGEDAPFLYFVDHSDPDLIEAVRRGRLEEFRDFAWEQPPPDPLSEDSFLGSRLCWEKREGGRHRVLLEWYGRLIAVRKETPPLTSLARSHWEVDWDEDGGWIRILRRHEGHESSLVMNFGPEDRTIEFPFLGSWKKVLDSSEECWMGPGSDLPPELHRPQAMTLKPFGLVLFEKTNGREFS